MKLLSWITYSSLLLAGPANAQFSSSCNKQHDKDSCFQTKDDNSGDACEWCVAGAVPSECMNPQQASLLPDGVFQCSSPSKYIFRNLEYSLHSVDPSKNDLCDGSVNSLSGYMDIKGSKYDDNGENKHLFYWMFEKRGEVDEDTPVCSCFVGCFLLLFDSY